jgi:hypothetical protein
MYPSYVFMFLCCCDVLYVVQLFFGNFSSSIYINPWLCLSYCKGVLFLQTCIAAIAVDLSAVIGLIARTSNFTILLEFDITVISALWLV